LLLILCGSIFANAQTNEALTATATQTSGGVTIYSPANYNDNKIVGFSGCSGYGTCPTPWGWVFEGGTITYTWSSPVTVAKVVFYFADRPMNSCTVQYWDGSSFVNIGNYSTAICNTDSMTFAPVTTTILRFVNCTAPLANPNFREILVLSPIPSPVITGGTTYCDGDNILLTANSTLPGPTYSWSGPGSFTATTSTISVTASPSTAGTYSCTVTSGGNTSVAATAAVVVNPLPTVTLGSIPDVCAGGTATTLPFTNPNNVVSKTVTFGYTGAFQSWTVPAGVTSIQVDMTGAAGGLNSDEITYPTRAGNGGRVQATLTVVPGQVLGLSVGGKGGDGTSVSGGTGGVNGGGNGAAVFGLGGGGGGGATDLSLSPFSFSDRLIVAGGGAGAGLNCSTTDQSRGGDGGHLIGEDGSALCSGGNGFGGTQLAGGAGGVCLGCPGAGGVAGTFGIGGDAGGGSAGSGAGAGWYGGGGGQWDGGGGGSSYTDATLASSVVLTIGTNTGDGQVTITYAIPSTYNIVWSGAAGTAGFVNVTNASVASSPINIAVPGTASANTYTGTFTITNSNTACTSAPYPISLNINPIPDVLPVSNQAVCNGATTTAITFGSSLSGTTYNWTNSDPSIGLAASGTGVSGIPSFTVTNTTSVPVNAVITVTPVRLGCLGAVQTFTITVNPTPNVAPSSNQILCNGVSTAAINFTGSVAGTVFSWTNTDPSIGLVASGTGNIAAFTATNSTPAPVTAVITVNTLANSCTGGSNSFTIVVNPTPVLSSLLNPPAICDNTTFSYTPTSLTSGTTFAWFRNTVTGISNPAATGTGNPNEILLNTTPNPIAVVYVDTLMANGCVNTQMITVVVNPTPMLTSTLSPAAVCSGTGFTYVHTSLTAGTIFTWSRDLVAGITNPASNGVDR
jgi:Glycine rich protein/PKD-like domain